MQRTRDSVLTLCRSPSLLFDATEYQLLTNDICDSRPSFACQLRWQQLYIVNFHLLAGIGIWYSYRRNGRARVCMYMYSSLISYNQIIENPTLLLSIKMLCFIYISSLYCFHFELLLSAQEVLRGTFYMASLMAHSCVVNAQISIGNDSQMTVKATVPIREGRVYIV